MGEDVAIDYSGVLDRIHSALLPHTYLEVGVQNGYTLALALPCTKAVGIDPAPVVLTALGANVRVESMTSDEFFDKGHAERVLGSKRLDFAFIDGLHLFEFALRDFLNVERHSHQDSVVILDDCLPRTPAEAQRDRSTVGWAGDVWRVLECLRSERPDLDITVIEAAPTGLALIRNLDPTSTVIDPSDQALIDRYLERDFGSFRSETLPDLTVIESEWHLIEPLLPASRQPHLDVEALVSQRAAIKPDLATRIRRVRYWVLHTRVGSRVGDAVRSVQRQM